MQFINPKHVTNLFIKQLFYTSIRDNGLLMRCEDTCPVCLRFLRSAPPLPRRMIPDSFLVLKDRLISVPTLMGTGASSTKPGLGKLTVWTFWGWKKIYINLSVLHALLSIYNVMKYMVVLESMKIHSHIDSLRATEEIPYLTLN